MNERDKTLRFVRFFLPRLGREQLAKEIDAEKERLRSASRAHISQLKSWAEETLGESQELNSRMVEYRKRKERMTVFLFTSFVVVISGVWLAMGLKSGFPLLLTLVGIGGLILCGKDYLDASQKERACRGEIASRQSTIQKRLESDVAAEENGLASKLSALDARLGELVQLYENSIATESEVVEFTQNTLSELQNLMAPALGLHVEDVLDERSAEIWAPSFLQGQEFPRPVLRDIEQSEQEIAGWANEIIEPMRTAMPNEEHWRVFRNRVLSILGLCKPAPDSDVHSNRLNPLRAVQFSASRQSYLAGHYFYQKIVCTEDSIGLFRAYVNVLNHRVSHTFAFQILYADIAAIGIETSLNREQFDLSSMMIDQHTHTLTLELSSGSTYRMSGDAGSSGQIKTAGDSKVEKVVSQANQAFRDQIVNVRSLIRDAKASRINNQR